MGRNKKGRKRERESNGNRVSRKAAKRLWNDLRALYVAFLVCYPIAYLTPAMLDSRFHERLSDAVWGAGLGELFSLGVYVFFHVELSKRDHDAVVRDLFQSGLLTHWKVAALGAIAGVLAGATPTLTGYAAAILGTGRAIDANVGRMILGPYVALLTMLAVISYDELGKIRKCVVHHRPMTTIGRIFACMWCIAIGLPTWLVTYSLFPQVGRNNGRGSKLDWDAPFSSLVFLTFLPVLVGIVVLVWSIIRKDDD